MAVSAPSRLLLLSLRKRTQSQCYNLIPLRQQHRSIFGLGGRNKERETINASKAAEEASTASHGTVPELKSGKLAPSIFDTMPETPQTRRELNKQEIEEKKSLQSREREEQEEEDELEEQHHGDEAERPISYKDLKPTFRNPRPRAMVRLERRMVILDVRGRHRLNKTEKILRTERFHAAKSPFIKTSIKKLGPLARQIAGKPIEEAMIQMRFSKKKAAQDVLKHLKYVRDQAVVAKGMGLRKVVGEGLEVRPEPKGLEAKLEKEGKVMVEDKKGKRRVITDRSAIYIDEAWVGRGQYAFGTDYRARGQGHQLRLPYTSISIVLKEEATRIRLHEEREQKRLRKPVWVPLPDRAITAQRQYPLW